VSKKKPLQSELSEEDADYNNRLHSDRSVVEQIVRIAVGITNFRNNFRYHHGVYPIYDPPDHSSPRRECPEDEDKNRIRRAMDPPVHLDVPKKLRKIM
jgi:hypothetical protein